MIRFLPSEPRRILIVRLGAIGDVARVLPMLAGLKARFPEAEVDWVVQSKAADLLRGHPEIARLLKDPEPNVRAAVLKVLAEKPSPAVVGIIGDYALAEKDPDLVGHAARALREAKTPQAAASLVKLLDHESWRVRAEAAEGLGEMIRHSSNKQELQADTYAALIKRLDDEDGYVASRAMAASLRMAERKKVVPTLARTTPSRKMGTASVSDERGSTWRSRRA